MGFTDIDLASWPRRDHFDLFRGMEHPYFGVTVELDLTAWKRATKAAGLPFYPALVHHVTAAANATEAFRLRIRGERVVLHDVVHPSFTVPWREDLFNFCLVDFDADLETFLARSGPAMEAATSADRLLLDPPGKDDMIFISCVPWFAFTGASQPGDARSGDSFPRFVWGRLIRRDGRDLLPLNVQLHHGLADGLHIGRFLERLEAGLAEHVKRLAIEAR